MSTYTRRKHGPQGQNNIAGKRNGHIYTTAQHGVAPGRTTDGVDCPFPNKPVRHRRPPYPRKQDSLDLDDFEKITITKQATGPLPPHSNGIREITAIQHPQEDSYRLPREELQMAKAIHAKELVLQEKLRRAEEKIRQKIQRDNVDAAAGHDQVNKEERPDRGQVERKKAQTKSTLSELQRREPVKGRERMMQERRQEDVKEIRKRQEQRNEDRMWNTHEKRAGWKRREIEIAHKAQSQTREIPLHGQEVSREPNKSRWGNAKQQTRRTAEDEKDDGNRLGTGVKERELSSTTMGDKRWPRDNKYCERMCKKTYGSDEERDMPQMSKQKTSHRAATEIHRGEGRKLSGEPLLSPVVSPHFSQPEQEELGLKESTYDDLQRLPCRICNRKFTSNRLEIHVQICKKLKQSPRQVFNSYTNRTKGSEIEEYFKTHSRSTTPEILKQKKQRQNKAYTKNLHEGRLPAGTSEPKWSKRADPNRPRPR